MTLPKTICMLPWTSLEVTPLGAYRPCCIYDEDIPGYNVTQGHTISEVQNSDYMKQLRQSFLAGERPLGCKTCWKEEEVLGRQSKRKATFYKMKNTKIDYTEASVAPVFLDLKLGNICNLKCRICGSWSSSKWAQEEIDLSDGNNPLAKQQLAQGAWPRKHRDWWDALQDALPHIEYIEFTGGEPFLIDEHFDLLQRLVDLGHAAKIDIHYNTNGTIWPKRGHDLWKNFKSVEIAFSIDDTGKRFEYQRYGSDWTQTEEVVKEARAAWLRDSNIKLQICTTFNIQNSYYWPETEDWIIKQGIHDIHYNILHHPSAFSLRNLPTDVKYIFEQRMRSARSRKIDAVVGFMNLPGTNMLDDLRDRLAKSDAYRKQKFSDAHFNVWKLIDGR